MGERCRARLPAGAPGGTRRRSTPRASTSRCGPGGRWALATEPDLARVAAPRPRRRPRAAAPDLPPGRARAASLSSSRSPATPGSARRGWRRSCSTSCAQARIRRAILVGRNPPYGRGIAFWALGEILRDAAGRRAEDSAERGRHAGARGSCSPISAPPTPTSSPGPSPWRSAPEPGRRGGGDAEDALKHAWRRLVALLAAERPLVLAIDDAHWADDGFLDLLEEVAFGVQEAPLVIVCTSRPELLERRPTFGRSARNVTQIELAPLRQRRRRPDRGAPLLPADGGEAAAGSPTVAGGNPFFAEEVARRWRSRATATAVGASSRHGPRRDRLAHRPLPAGEKRVLQVRRGARAAVSRRVAR